MKRSTMFMGAGVPFGIAGLVASSLDQVWFYVLAACAVSLFATGSGFWIYDRE
ncbi:hypothetical protein ABGT16_05240 [Pseudomonas asiatica]|uniref:hypothetical protein n=1 Tax=Pseudomonas asiatica TaxID=2219225 RepID=UPI00345D2211